MRVLGNFYALSLMSCLADGFVRSARSLIGGCLVPCILEFEGDIISRACRPSLKTVLVTDRRHCQDESESRERERESLLDLYSRSTYMYWDLNISIKNDNIPIVSYKYHSSSISIPGPECVVVASISLFFFFKAELGGSSMGHNAITNPVQTS